MADMDHGIGFVCLVISLSDLFEPWLTFAVAVSLYIYIGLGK